MTPDEIKKSVEVISAVAGDNEDAHIKEDELHLAVLTAIADGTCDDPRACAAEAIKTQAIEFTRWHA